jgi:hypothetical protein
MLWNRTSLKNSIKKFVDFFFFLFCVTQQFFCVCFLSFVLGRKPQKENLLVVLIRICRLKLEGFWGLLFFWNRTRKFFLWIFIFFYRRLEFSSGKKASTKDIKTEECDRKLSTKCRETFNLKFIIVHEIL